MTAPTDDITIYVVDDDPDIRMSMEVSLEIHGYQTEMFETAEAFLHKTPDKPGCLLLDLNLGGGMNGLELQDEMVKRSIHLPIIFITGHGGSPELKRAMDAGAIAFLQKPFQPKVLMEHIQTALSQLATT